MVTEQRKTALLEIKGECFRSQRRSYYCSSSVRSRVPQQDSGFITRNHSAPDGKPNLSPPTARTPDGKPGPCLQLADASTAARSGANHAASVTRGGQVDGKRPHRANLTAMR